MTILLGSSKPISVLKTVPAVTIRETVIFPHTENQLTFSRPKLITAVRTAFNGAKLLAIFT
jgi:ATP-dependent Lon protease